MNSKSYAASFIVALLVISAGCLGMGPTGPTDNGSSNKTSDSAPDVTFTTCASDETCEYTLTVNSTGDADAILVEYDDSTSDELYGERTVRELGTGDSLNISTDSAVYTYLKYDGLDMLEVHSIYRPAMNVYPDGEIPDDMAEPNAAVAIEQEAGEQGQRVQTTLVSLDNADSVAVETSEAEQTLTTVGATAELTGLSPGDTVTVTATLDGEENVIRTFTVS